MRAAKVNIVIMQDVVPKTKVAAFVNRKDTGDLVVFTPVYKSVRLVCGKRPKLDDVSVAYCA